MSEVDWLIEKTDFLIETIEQFVDFDELKTRIVKQAEENARALLDAPENYRIEFEDEEVWLVLICHLTAQWAISHNLGPNILLNQLRDICSLLYSVDIVRRKKLIAKGLDPKTNDDPLNDYKS